MEYRTDDPRAWNESKAKHDYNATGCVKVEKQIKIEACGCGPCQEHGFCEHTVKIKSEPSWYESSPNETNVTLADLQPLFDCSLAPGLSATSTSGVHNLLQKSQEELLLSQTLANSLQIPEVTGPDSEFVCSVCGRSFFCERGLRIHKTVICNSLRAPKTYTPDSDSVCSVCGRSFFSERGLRIHETVVCIPSKKQITLSNKIKRHNKRYLHSIMSSSSDRSSLKKEPGKHLQKTTHKERPSHICSDPCSLHFHPNSIGKRFTCELCGSAFTHYPELSIHLEKVHATKIFPCAMCKDVFVSSRALAGHMSFHTMDLHGDRLYKCTVCHYICSDEAIFRGHVLLHSGQEILRVNMVLDNEQYALPQHV